jgi:hypothetical protein
MRALLLGLALLAGCAGKPGDALLGDWRGGLNQGGLGLASLIFRPDGALHLVRGNAVQDGAYSVTAPGVLHFTVEGRVVGLRYRFLSEHRIELATTDEGQAPASIDAVPARLRAVLDRVR